MSTVFFCGDPHGRFSHIVRAVKKHRPEAVILLGDQTAAQSLDIELAPILDQTQVYWTCGNHDTYNERHHDNLFESKLKGRNIQEQGVIRVGGILIACIGGVFREKVWAGSLPKTGEGVAHPITSPKDFAKTCGAGNRWRGGVPLRYRSTIFPSMVEKYRDMHVDVLVTHETPDLHRHGNAGLMRLANDLGVRGAFRGHHHQRIDYPDSVWQGVSLCGIVGLDTATFEVTDIDPGLVSKKQYVEIF